MKRCICLLALPLLSLTACLDPSDQDPADGTSSQAVAAPPVSTQATGNNICESHGQFCVGAPTIAFEDPVVETLTGRLFQIVFVAGGINLAFTAEPNKCVAIKNNSNLVEVRACTQPSAVWVPQTGPDGHSCVFQNQGRYLSGHNMAGSQFTVESKGASDAFQQFASAGITCG